MKYLLSGPLEIQKISVLEEPMCFLTLESNKRLITSETTLQSSVCGLVVYKVLKSKVERDLAFLLKLVLLLFLTFA